jgi:hypothetical protein
VKETSFKEIEALGKKWSVVQDDLLEQQQCAKTHVALMSVFLTMQWTNKSI